MTKKLTAVILFLTLLLGGCSAATVSEDGREQTEINIQNSPTQEKPFTAVWISYIELTGKCGSAEEFSDYTEQLFVNFTKVGVTDVFFHVRPFADAIYESDIFPSSTTVCENQGDKMSFDPLEAALSLAAEYGISLHAWINPYRASATADIESLSEESPARVMYERGDGSVNLIGGRLYFNPAREQVRSLITDGARELLTKYPSLAGIHIDDYFYPEACGNFDSDDYMTYSASGGELTVEQWRRENVNMLLRELYSEVKSFGKEKLFTVSPDGKIDTCINNLYADVELWATEGGYCDMLLPQIYFGFENSSQPFEKCLGRWAELCEGSEVKLAPALALYKCGKEDIYAGSGSQEWILSSDVIKRQVLLIRSKGLYGFGLYSGSYVNFYESFYKKELDNLISVL